MKVEISPTARVHIAELVAWWDANRPASRARVETSLEEVLEAIVRHPYVGRTYSKKPQYRMWRLRGTPYFAFYRVDEEARVIRLSAVWSGVRGEKPDLG